MISCVTTTDGEKVFIDAGHSGGAVRITVGDGGGRFYLTNEEARKLVDILSRYLTS